jgi:hypothetical protein
MKTLKKCPYKYCNMIHPIYGLFSKKKYTLYIGMKGVASGLINIK